MHLNAFVQISGFASDPIGLEANQVHTNFDICSCNLGKKIGIFTHNFSVVIDPLLKQLFMDNKQCLKTLKTYNK